MPRVVNHAARREAIASAAATVIAERGIDRVTMSAVARAAGCTVGALPHYFDGKDEILIAALRQVHRRVRERAASVALHTCFDPVEVWLSFLPTAPPQRLEWKVWIAFASRAVYADRLAAEFDARYRQGEEDTRRMLAALQEGGALPRALDLERATAAMIATVDGMGLRATLEPTRWPVERLRAQVAWQLGQLGHQP